MRRGLRIRRQALLAGAVALAALGAPGAAESVHAQTPAEQCATQQGTSAAIELCGRLADAAEILLSRSGIAVSGGNLVPGSSSTMGMRLGTMPRVGVAMRISGAAVGLPAVQRTGANDNVNAVAGSINADFGVGLFQGISLLPTVGGFASLDLLASIGIAPLPGGSDFGGGAPFTWAVGARAGLLRESFTAPGVSVDVMYRRFGERSYGDEQLRDGRPQLLLEATSATSVRGTVGKRVLGYGLTGGAGWDRYRADVTGRVPDGTLLNPNAVVGFEQSGLTTDRLSFFGNVSLTVLILNLAAEIGWQAGDDGPAATDRLRRGGLFGGLSGRLAI